MTTDGRLTDGRLTDGTSDPGDPINPSINIPKHNTGPDGPPGRGDDRPQVVRGPGGGRARGTPAQGTHVGWSGVWVLFYVGDAYVWDADPVLGVCLSVVVPLGVRPSLTPHTEPVPNPKTDGPPLPPQVHGPQRAHGRRVQERQGPSVHIWSDRDGRGGMYGQIQRRSDGPPI